MKKFVSKVWLSSPTLHEESELLWVKDAFDKNWITTAGDNVNEIEKLVAEYVGCRYAVALSCGTAALHLATKLAGEKLYGMPKPHQGSLHGHKAFISDVTFYATANPIAYENGEAIFIDSERDTWNMDPVALEKAFALYPDVKLVVLVHLYGTPAKFDEIKAICDKYGALIIEDAAESFGATYKNKQTGNLTADYSAISFNGNKIITGSSGGMFLTNSKEDAEKVRKWSTQSREAAPWYQHEEIGFNMRISNIVSGIIRGQLPYLNTHISKKRDIYMRYKEGFKGLPVTMNPYDETKSEPNFWLSCMLINEEAMCRQVRSAQDVLYIHEDGKTCPTEILEKLNEINAEGRPIWKPMHAQPIYRMNPYITAQDNRFAYIEDSCNSVGMDLFNRGLCLPSDIKMTPEQQDYIIEVIKKCFE